MNEESKKKVENSSADDKVKQPKVVYYKVMRGDTLWSIANKHGASVQEIKQLNNLKSNNSLKAGSKIKVSVNS